MTTRENTYGLWRLQSLAGRRKVPVGSLLITCRSVPLERYLSRAHSESWWAPDLLYSSFIHIEIFIQHLLSTKHCFYVLWLHEWNKPKLGIKYKIKGNSNKNNIYIHTTYFMILGSGKICGKKRRVTKKNWRLREINFKWVIRPHWQGDMSKNLSSCWQCLSYFLIQKFYFLL